MLDAVRRLFQRGAADAGAPVDWKKQGNEHLAQGRLEEATRCYRQAVDAAPADGAACLNLGYALLEQQQFTEARRWLQQALRLGAKEDEALFLLARAERASGDVDAALRSYAGALAANPDFGHAMQERNQLLAELAGNLVDAGQYVQAQARFEALLEVRPGDADVMLARANCLLALDRWPEALAAYDEVLAVAPQAAQAHLNRGNALLEMDRLEEALESFRAALRARPAYLEALVNIGSVLQALNRYEEACDMYTQAIAVAPDSAAAHWNLGLSRLVLGELASGWAEAEWRWQALGRTPLASTRPLWTGEQPLEGKTVLAYAEQGLGDTLQFCRYVAPLARRGAKVVLRVQPPLQKLLRTLRPACDIISDQDPLPPHDYHCALMSLPLALGTTLQTIPADVPYLASQPELVARWREVLGTGAKLRVGLAWSGNPAHINDRNRSLRLADLQVATPGVQLVSVQKEVRAQDVPALQAAGIAHHGERLTDFEQTAALIECLDLLITVDTSVAHLAGALGKPVWILLPFSPDWRWLLERANTPWYPSARLFRQPRHGDWAPVIAAVREALAARAGA